MDYAEEALARILYEEEGGKQLPWMEQSGHVQNRRRTRAARIISSLKKAGFEIVRADSP